MTVTRHAGQYASAWSPRRLAATPSFELVPGVILRGANIAPKASHAASGHAYRAFFAEWDWTGWIKPQIDAAHTLGANAIRLIGDFEGVNDGTFTQAYYNACWDQLHTYTATLGMYSYPAGGGVSQITAGSLSNATVAATLAAVAPTHAGHSNVVGFDLIQESVRATVSGSYALSFPSTFVPPVKAAAPNLKVTFSNTGVQGWGRFAYSVWKDVLRPWVDFWDVHWYFTATPDALFSAFWGKGEDKPVVIGEFGIAQSASSTDQTAFYAAVAAMVNNRPGAQHAAGAFAWSIYDQDSTAANQWGLFNNDPAQPRTAVTVPFANLPLA